MPPARASARRAGPAVPGRDPPAARRRRAPRRPPRLGRQGARRCVRRLAPLHPGFFFFFSSRRRHTRLTCDWSSDVCSSDLGAEAQGAVGEGGRKSGPPGAKGGGSPRLARLRRLIGRGLEGTAALWSDVERAYGWGHPAAHILNNPDGEGAAKGPRRFDGPLAAMARHRGQAGSLAEAVGHFCKVARSYRPGLFHCYAVPGMPRTDNGLEQLFGSQRYHERRANGRKAASPAAVLRGEVRLIAATATRLRPPDARELGGVNRDAWTALRHRLDRRRHARTLRTRFRRDPDAYLTALEQGTCQPILPA